MNGLFGADRLEGKGGNDMLIGGQGSDTFVFKPGFGRDTIADFVVEGSTMTSSNSRPPSSPTGTLCARRSLTVFRAR